MHNREDEGIDMSLSRTALSIKVPRQPVASLGVLV